MSRNWTADEIRTLALAYFEVLRAERAGQAVNKTEILRDVHSKLPGRTEHTLSDRCARISQALDEHGLPWVSGWKPPALANQRANTSGQSKLIWEVLEPMLPAELPGALPPRALPRPFDVDVIHEEGPTWAEPFLRGFLPAAIQGLARYLGRQPSGVLPIVLSDTDTHEARFPPDLGEILDLDDPFESQLIDDTAHRFKSWGNYAHGICTVAAAEQIPPPGVTLGELAIYLDVETIERLAAEHNVSAEAMLARVTVHELAHAFRGHPTGAGRATHGWFHEGDAQRDAWHVLTELLADSTWRQVMVSARAAQVRLSRGQPPAYQRFPVTPAEGSHLSGAEPPVPVTWILGPPRSVATLVKAGVVEVPAVMVSHRDEPRPGDEVFLADNELVAGPWVVVAITPRSRFGHPIDHEAVQARRDPRHPPTVGWLQLRPLHPQQAATSTGTSWSSNLYTTSVDAPQAAELRADLSSSAEWLADRIGEDRRAEFIDTVAGAGVRVPERIVIDYDPFDDRFLD